MGGASEIQGELAFWRASVCRTAEQSIEGVLKRVARRPERISDSNLEQGSQLCQIRNDDIQNHAAGNAERITKPQHRRSRSAPTATSRSFNTEHARTAVTITGGRSSFRKKPETVENVPVSRLTMKDPANSKNRGSSQRKRDFSSSEGPLGGLSEGLKRLLNKLIFRHKLSEHPCLSA